MPAVLRPALPKETAGPSMEGRPFCFGSFDAGIAWNRNENRDYLEEDADGWLLPWRIWRHSLSRRSMTWAGMVAALVFVWVVLLVCIDLLLTAQG